MVGKTGFEPATPWSQTKCSTKLSHFPIHGAPNRSRTHNLLIRSQTLYPIELWAHMFITNKITCAQNYIFKMVASVGIEPTTPRFSVLCSANWAMKPKWMAVPTGIEPAIPRVTGECDNRYTTEPFGCRRWIWTTGLWVMSPTSYQTALSCDIIIQWRRKRDSNPRTDFSISRFSRPVPSAGLGYSSIIFGAPDRTWTDMSCYTRRILSPVRLPIPPLRHL